MKIPDAGFQNVLNNLKRDKKEKQKIPSEIEKNNISEGFKIYGKYLVAIIDRKKPLELSKSI